MKPKNLLFGTVAIIVILIVGFLIAKAGKTSKETPSTSSSTTSSTSSDNSSTATTSENAIKADVTIKYSDSGFSPANATIKSGQTLAVENDSGQTMQFDSNPHPEHTDNTELNIGVISAGQTKTVTLTKMGTWGFHNHLSPGDTGKITVQ